MRCDPLLQRALEKMAKWAFDNVESGFRCGRTGIEKETRIKNSILEAFI